MIIRLNNVNLAMSFVMALLSIGCASKATTPMPKEELSSIGQHSRKGGSYEIAFNSAEKFCKRWNAAPSITRKQVKYQGQFAEDDQAVIDIGVDVIRATGNWIPGIGSNDAYETTLTYKCY